MYTLLLHDRHQSCIHEPLREDSSTTKVTAGTPYLDFGSSPGTDSPTIVNGDTPSDVTVVNGVIKDHVSIAFVQTEH